MTTTTIVMIDLATVIGCISCFLVGYWLGIDTKNNRKMK